MNSRELEELNLLLIRDAAQTPTWIDHWARSYPTNTLLEAHSGHPQQLRPAFHLAARDRRPLAAVAHGAGATALLDWLYHADYTTRNRLQAIILAMPDTHAFRGDAARAVCPCPTALISETTDSHTQAVLSRQAAQWRATLLTAPDRPAYRHDNWPWAARLLQEMLLA